MRHIDLTAFFETIELSTNWPYQSNLIILPKYSMSSYWQKSLLVSLQKLFIGQSRHNRLDVAETIYLDYILLSLPTYL